MIRDSTIQPGEFNRRVTLQRPVYNTAGDQIASWTSVATVWAKVAGALVPATANKSEKQESGRVVTVGEFTISIRYRSDITTVWRLLYPGAVERAGNVHGIRDVDDVNADHVRIELTCRKVL